MHMAEYCFVKVNLNIKARKHFGIYVYGLTCEKLNLIFTSAS